MSTGRDGKGCCRMASAKTRMISLPFPPDLVQFIDELTWRMLKSGKHHRKLSRSEVLRSLITVFKGGRFSIAGLENQEEFAEAVLSQIKARRAKKRKNGK